MDFGMRIPTKVCTPRRRSNLAILFGAYMPLLAKKIIISDRGQVFEVSFAVTFELIIHIARFNTVVRGHQWLWIILTI